MPTSITTTIRLLTSLLLIPLSLGTPLLSTTATITSPTNPAGKSTPTPLPSILSAPTSAPTPFADLFTPTHASPSSSSAGTGHPLYPRNRCLHDHFIGYYSDPYCTIPPAITIHPGVSIHNVPQPQGEGFADPDDVPTWGDVDPEGPLADSRPTPQGEGHVGLDDVGWDVKGVGMMGDA